MLTSSCSTLQEGLTPSTASGVPSTQEGVIIPLNLRRREAREERVPEARSVRPEGPITDSSAINSSAGLPHFVANWEQVTSSKFILQIVRDGYQIQFSSEPYQKSFTPRLKSRNTIKVCSRKVTQFLLHGTIIEVEPSHDQFLSDIFPVPKKSLTDHRVILDLSEFQSIGSKNYYEFFCLCRFPWKNH